MTPGHATAKLCIEGGPGHLVEARVGIRVSLRPGDDRLLSVAATSAVREQLSDKACGKFQPPECFADTALGGVRKLVVAGSRCLLTLGSRCFAKKAFQMSSSCLSGSVAAEQRGRCGQATDDRELSIGARVKIPGHPGTHRLTDDAHVHR